ncbi:V-type H+-transporting ATPase subunit e [Nematocida minor]|uniref:V-type H+-transporting ATPase subunit e n=1 Tax=Nematocida minor TaxID=1912983 RepID=UPI00221E8FB0|nr:V-type H+-transporting ATPase subunit e [Nematocida minor]KAI5192459.1 V-type H+-transporting ATPase subunit e [Nematocida minor]
MNYFHIQEHPLLVVIIVSVFAMLAARMACIMAMGYIKFKTESSKEVVIFSLYTSAACLLLSWACIYLGQARPMIEPK